MIHHLLMCLVILLLVIYPYPSFAQANCTRVCGDKVHANAVPYPFGFSDSCEIPLDCTADGVIRIGQYTIQNITKDNILVNLPTNCDRPYEEIRVFGSQNYALSSRNGLLLENCSSTLDKCVMSTSQLESRFNLQQCYTGTNNTIINGTGINNSSISTTIHNSITYKTITANVTVTSNVTSNSSISSNSSSNSNYTIITTNSNNNSSNSIMNCYSEDNWKTEELMNLMSMEEANCEILLSSITGDLNGSNSTSMPVEFQFLELGWWVRGSCGCDQNAVCHNVTKANQTIGYRCNCDEGFVGDGFAAGEGCRKDGGGTHWVIIALALCGGGVTIAIIIILWLRGKLRWRKKPKYNANVETFLKNHEFLAPKRYSYSQVKKMTNSFKTKLGQGGFGSVYKGVLSNQCIVAVKVLSELKGNGEDFINEVASVGRTSHVNIVSLVGFCSEGHRRALIYEFMPNGSLEKFIYGQSSLNHSQLGWEKLHQIAIGIARGLEYLYKGCNTRILHLDIKPRNILLDQDMCPKISDFGLSKPFPDRASMISMSRMRGTPGYIAPELFSRNFGQVSHKSDVYSYGMMVLEMVGGRKYIEVEVDHTSEIYFPHWIYKKLDLDEQQLGLHGVVSDEENELARKMVIVGLWCIQTNPSNRPTITKVLEMLEGDSQSLEIPPKPYLSSPSRDVS